MNKTSLKSKKLAKVLFAILFGATILTGCEVNVSEDDKIKVEKILSANITADSKITITDEADFAQKAKNEEVKIYPKKYRNGKGIEADFADGQTLQDLYNGGKFDFAETYNNIVEYVVESAMGKKEGFTYADSIVIDSKTNDNPVIDPDKPSDDDNKSTTIGGIKVVNNGITLESLDNISALQNLSEEDKEIAKTVKILNIGFPEKEDKTNYSVNLVDI